MINGKPTSRLRSHHTPRPLRTAVISLPMALRRLRTMFSVIYTRSMPTSVRAATKSTARLSLHLSRALDAGATTAQIHRVMDEAQDLANRRPSRQTGWLFTVHHGGRETFAEYNRENIQTAIEESGRE
jgi:hypothetical protein